MTELIDRLRCVLLRKHDWKRVVRTGETSGIEACKHCPTTQTVTLRKAPRAASVSYTHPVHDAGAALPRSQWPVQ